MINDRTMPMGLKCLILVAVLGLTACGGPGVGGTGTGGTPVSMSFTGIAAGGVTFGPAPACIKCTRADLRLEDTLVELKVPCGRFVHTTVWNTQAAQVDVAGVFESTSSGAPTSFAATLRLQFSQTPSTSQQLTATLVDSDGRPLVGPLTLQRDASGVLAPAACSP